MSYQEIIKKVARTYNTTADEVDKEIRLAIKSAGIKMRPERFIEIMSVLTQTNICKKADRGN